MKWFKIKSENDYNLLVVNKYNLIHRVYKIRYKLEYYNIYIQNCNGRKYGI